MLTGAKEKALHMKATIDWTDFEDEIADYLRKDSPAMWRRIFTPLIRGIMTDQGQRWASVLGVTFDVQNLFARDWYLKYIDYMPIPIIDTTAKEVGKLIDDAISEGWSIPQMQDAIVEMFDITEPYRSERIARTETIRASNAGSDELFKEWGVKQHEWLSTPDDRTRGPDSERSPSEFDHIGANGEVVNIGEPFTWTGKPLMYPGDPAGDPGNTINCRCTVLPIVEGME